MALDHTDFKIIEILTKNGRVSHEAVAKEINLSRPAVRSRIITLEKNKVITGYTAQIDYSKLGYPIQVLIYIKLNNTTYKNAILEIEKIKIDDILKYSSYRVSGEWSIVLKVMSKTQTSLTYYLDALKEISGLTQTNTVFLFNN